ncbi:hypothetical protein O0L34_g7167 [Tuta absoluta]|nr:hypothetical protein O0L34_g7167 [Tuta absoluta]
MNSPSRNSSPTFKNLKSRHKQSPVELKEKMRKNYKDKVHNCRDLLLNRFRGSVEEMDIRNTLTEIYKSMFNFSNDYAVDDEETKLLEEIRNELVQEELQWWLQEYEKSQFENIDWSSMEQEEGVICPVCQKTNLTLQNSIILCPNCKTQISTTKTLADVKNSVISGVEKHSLMCNNDVQFTVISESNESHIYLICESCMEMQAVI